MLLIEIQIANVEKLTVRILVTLAVFLVFQSFLYAQTISTEQVNSKSTIIWYTFDSPPVTITEGKYFDEGFGDQNRLKYQSLLTEYKHITRTSNYKRALFEMKNGENVCSSALLKNTEREKFITYSHPNFLILPNGVLIRGGDRHLFDPYIDPSNRLNLSLALEEKELVLGVSAGRQYGSGVDPLLEKIKLNKPSQILVRSGPDVISGLIYMLHNRRVDLVLGFSTEHEYAAHVSGNEAATEFLPIAEQRPFTLGYTGCTKGEWGDRVVEQINSILEEPEVFESFVQYYKRWLPNSNYAYYDELLDQALADHIEFQFFRKLR